MKHSSKQSLLNTPPPSHQEDIRIISWSNICQIQISKGIERKQNIDGNQEQQGPVMNWWKLTLNNPKLDVTIYAYAKFGQNPFIRSQDIERKWNSDMSQGP